MATPYLTFAELGQAGVPFKETQLQRLEARGEFPRRVMLGAKTTRWVKAEVEAWLRAKEAARAMGATCWICGNPATRVMDGRNCCAAHTQLSRHPTDPPPAPCAVVGCGAESNRREYGFPLGAGHGPADLPERSF